MDPTNNPYKFWFGNAILAVALLALLYMDQLWHRFGVWAMTAWIVLVVIGAYLVTSARE